MMLEKVPGETAWKTAEKVTDKVLFQGHNVTSLKLKRRLCWRQLGTAMNLVLHTSLHISAKSPHAQSHFAELSRSVRFHASWRNVAVYALWGIWAKCRDLRALTHVGKMSRFTHFARHKILAARHFQLFCTPGCASGKVFYFFSTFFLNCFQLVMGLPLQ